MISKNVSALILAFVISAFSYVQAQRIEYQGKKYMVKGESIFLDKQDVTSVLSYQDQINIKSALSAKLANERITEAEKTQSRAEKAQKKAEKAQKKAEKARQKAERALKKKDRAQDNLGDSKKKYKNANNKYEKRKSRGKLSPDDEAKWQKKLEKQEKDINKDKKKLNKQD